MSYSHTVENLNKRGRGLIIAGVGKCSEKKIRAGGTLIRDPRVSIYQFMYVYACNIGHV